MVLPFERAIALFTPKSSFVAMTFFYVCAAMCRLRECLVTDSASVVHSEKRITDKAVL